MPNLLVNGVTTTMFAAATGTESFKLADAPILWVIICAGAAGIVIFIERALHCHRAQINSTEFLNGVRTVIKRDNLVEANGVDGAFNGTVTNK